MSPVLLVSVGRHVFNGLGARRPYLLSFDSSAVEQALSSAPTIDKLFNTIVSGSFMFNAIDKVFYILDQFTNEKPQWGVRELSIKIGLTPNLTHWYLKNLERNHAVRKDSQTDKYELGYRIFEIGNRNSKHRLLKILTQPVLAELSRETRGTAVLRVLEAGELICVASAESSYSLRVNYSEGAREACNFGCIGKLLMAHLDAADSERLVMSGQIRKFTAKTVMEYTQEGMGKDSCSGMGL